MQRNQDDNNVQVGQKTLNELLESQINFGGFGGSKIGVGRGKNGI